jgi:hypothetical protein
MKLLTISAARPMCSTCHAARAWLGERECGDCLMETRLALWLQEEGALPGDWAGPWSMSVDEALCWASGGVMRPRIVEVPPATPRDRFWERLPLARPLPAMVTVSHFRSVVRWVSIAGIGMLMLGFVFGKFCK